MEKQEIKQIIDDTVTTTVLKLKAAGLLKDGSKTAYEKTEALLYQYPELKEVDEPYARRVVQEVDACMEAVKNDPYVDVIRLYYFDGMTNLGVANTMCCEESTARKNRRRLVRRFSARLASEEFIRELLM